MSDDNVKLLGGRASPYSNRVEMALNLKGINYEFIKESFVPKSDLLLKSNPIYKKIPVLFHKGNPICESLVILQYIDDVWTHSHSLLPSNPYDRAIARFWATYIDDKWFASLREELILGKDEAREKTVEATAVIEAAYWDISKGKMYFGGDEIGYVDLVLGCYLGWAKLAEKELVGLELVSESKTPGLTAWANTFSSNPVIKSFVQQPEDIMDFYKVVKARFASAAT